MRIGLNWHQDLPPPDPVVHAYRAQRPEVRDAVVAEILDDVATCREIADRHGVSPDTVRNWRARLGLPPRPKGPRPGIRFTSSLEIEAAILGWLARARRCGSAELARQALCTTRTVCRHLARLVAAGVVVRDGYVWIGYGREARWKLANKQEKP